MGMKLYVKDDLGREFTNHEWAMSDTKALAGLLISQQYLKTIQTHFRVNVDELSQIQRASEIRRTHKEHWSHIHSLLREVKLLKRALQNTSDYYSSEIFLGLNLTAIELFGNTDEKPDFTDQYFVYGWFYEDLDDLERLLYYLLHSGAKQVHLYCA